MKKALKRVLKIVLPGILIVGAAFVALHEDFYISEITIMGNDKVTNEEILRMLPFGGGEHLFAIPLRSAERIISSDPRIAWTEIQRRFGGKVVILVREEHPALLFVADRLWGLTEKGIVIPFDEPFQIPNLIVLSCTNLEVAVSPYRAVEEPRVATGLEFFREIREKAPQFLDRISEIHVAENDEVTAILTGDGLAVEFGRGDSERKFMRLAAILDNMGANRASAVKIDLRYSDQAVVQLDHGTKKKVWG